MANSSYISLLKRIIKSEIINDPLIVKTFGSPNYDPTDIDFSGKDVGENHIFTWNQDPETIKETITFLTIMVHTYRTRDGKWVIPRLEFWIYSHNRHMKLDPKEFPGIASNRNDYLSQLLDDKFNGRTSFGTGTSDQINLMNELVLSINQEGVQGNKFPYRNMVFETKDINNSFCAGW